MAQCVLGMAAYDRCNKCVKNSSVILFLIAENRWKSSDSHVPIRIPFLPWRRWFLLYYLSGCVLCYHMLYTCTKLENENERMQHKTLHSSLRPQVAWHRAKMDTFQLEAPLKLELSGGFKVHTASFIYLRVPQKGVRNDCFGLVHPMSCRWQKIWCSKYQLYEWITTTTLLFVGTVYLYLAAFGTRQVPTNREVSFFEVKSRGYCAQIGFPGKSKAPRQKITLPFPFHFTLNWNLFALRHICTSLREFV